MGLIANVVPNAPIASAWGNAIRDRTVQSFASPAERDSQWTVPPAGALCITLDTMTLYRYAAGAWVSLSTMRGVIVGDGTQRFPGAANTVMPIPNVYGGPASWLAANTVTIPADAAGLYLISLFVSGRSSSVAATPYPVRNSAGADYSPPMLVGGVVATSTAQQNHNGTWLRQCVGGDTFRVYHAGNALTNPDWASVIRFSFLRVGDALAAT